MKLQALIGRMRDHVKGRIKQNAVGRGLFALGETETYSQLLEMYKALEEDNEAVFLEAFETLMSIKQNYSKDFYKNFPEEAIYTDFYNGEYDAQWWWDHREVTIIASLAKGEIIVAETVAP